MSGNQSFFRFDKFESIKDSGTGQIIVLASGPSANDFPLLDFSEIPVVAMNGSIIKCRQEGVAPYFYICDDEDFVRNRSELVKEALELSKNIAMTQDCYESFKSIYPNFIFNKRYYLLERVNRINGRRILPDREYAWSIRKDPDLISGFSLLSQKPNRIGFSSDLSKGYFGSRTIPYAGIQLARHLGFNKVFLVGVDMNPAAGRFYETGQAAMPSTLDVDFNKYILPSFSLLSKKIIKLNKFEVFNLSPESRIPSLVIKKISLEKMKHICFKRK